MRCVRPKSDKRETAWITHSGASGSDLDLDLDNDALALIELSLKVEPDLSHVCACFHSDAEFGLTLTCAFWNRSKASAMTPVSRSVPEIAERLAATLSELRRTRKCSLRST